MFAMVMNCGVSGPRKLYKVDVMSCNCKMIIREHVDVKSILFFFWKSGCNSNLLVVHADIC